ncbi:MAG: ABC transporter permease [Woeseia sp.]|nr:ABC transporter permease [Woeseia sp.]MBT8097403.1 ABC transporter permease [Woeseia sp.]NNE60150.1 ABC transporter permease [Woeseia sp.]NNL53856.1 ABC transporter permease [Woeseia sp.]
MGVLKVVFGKEVMDNFRDRRTLMSALLMGPLFGPILFAFVINLSLKQSLSDDTEALKLPVIGQEHAPNLISYLQSENIDLVEAPSDREAAIEAVKDGTHDVVVVVPAEFGEQFAAGTPALIEVISDQANTSAEREARRARRALAAYGQELAAMRLTLRGVNQLALRPLNIDEVDVSTPSGRSAILLGMLSYFFIFALLTGGMNLAIDATAGERERGSLEPLLCLPVSRDKLIIGKILAACLFMAISLFLSLASFFVTLKFLPLEQIGMTPNFGPQVVIFAFFLLVPFALLGASLMTLVASFTRSYKEAQTWLSAVLLAPTLPILIVSILQVRPSTELMLVPSLSQHLLLNGLIRNEPLNMLHVAVSVCSTLALGALLAFVCARLYRREGLLG